MGRAISIGAQNFEDLRNNNYFYIDKTNFIKEWFESGDKVTLITRPRRFGKTLNMNMLECFFSTRYAARSDLFDGLNIWQDEKYQNIQGTWPVIFISFADIKGKTYKDSRDGIISVLLEMYQMHSHLISSDVLTPNEKKTFFTLGQQINADENIYNIISDDAISRSIKRLTSFLYRYYGKNTIILLDEYDTPMQEAWIGGYWSEIASLIRSLFNSTFKTNPYLERGLMTGITRVSKESIFSDINNLRVVTTTSDEYADCFGFTEQEVFDSLDEMDMSESRDIVKKWYDGFTFGRHKEIYNPWSITNFLKEKKLGTYWAGTSSNSLISRIIRQGDVKTKQIMEDLLAGNNFKCIIDEQIVFNQLDKVPNAIWSLLLASGYLKVVTPPPMTGTGTAEDLTYELTLTNKEVHMMFDKLIREWFYDDGDNYNDFVQAMLKNNLEEMNIYMSKVVLNTISYFDTGNRPSEQAEPERFYHGLVLGLIVDLQGRYVITSNRESGYGRYDIMMEPLRDNDPAFILEFKVFNPNKESGLENTVASALHQIENKKYDAQLRERSITEERIRKYGFAFEGKRVLIG